jgi:alanine-glyoxylate transaminase / serine-glyoxylate transaminase / serine-pyruvate transaminase
MAAAENARLPPRLSRRARHGGANAKGGYPYTPPVQLMSALAESIEHAARRGLDAVFARHHRIAEGVRRAVAAWGLRALRGSRRTSIPTR